MSRIRGKTPPQNSPYDSSHTPWGCRYRLHVKTSRVNLTWSSGTATRSSSSTGAFGTSTNPAAEPPFPPPIKSYWLPKLQRNVQRDRASIRALKRDGWRVLVLWECQLKDTAKLQRRIRKFLDPPPAHPPEPYLHRSNRASSALN